MIPFLAPPRSHTRTQPPSPVCPTHAEATSTKKTCQWATPTRRRFVPQRQPTRSHPHLYSYQRRRSEQQTRQPASNPPKTRLENARVSGRPRQWLHRQPHWFYTATLPRFRHREGACYPGPRVRSLLPVARECERSLPAWQRGCS